MASLLRSALVAVAVAVASPAALAQAPSRVPISGSVRDIHTRDGYLAGATVTITSHRSGDTITLVTGPDGTFWGPALDPGVYTVSVSMPGFGSLVINSFCVVAGKPARLDAGLGPDRSGTPAPPSPPSDRTLVTAPPATAGSDGMTPSEIQEAMAFGRRSTKLRAHQVGGLRGPERQRMAALFTPFWRVATMTQVAAATGRQFTEREIPVAFIQKLAWIVGYPIERHVNDQGGMSSTLYLVPVNDIVIRPKGANATDDITPAWKMYLRTECDVDNLESVLGRQFSIHGMVAAFPLDSIKPGSAVVFTYAAFATPLEGFRIIPSKREVQRVVISDGDLRKWK